MASIAGPSTYDLTTGIMLDIEDLIHLLSPTDTPLTGGYGADGRTALPNGSCFEKKVEWLHEDLLTPKSTLQTTLADGVGTSVVVPSGHGLRFSPGDVILIENEYIRITSISTDTFTVVRAFGGSSGAAHTSGVVILNLGQTLAEGADPEAARWKDRTGVYNMTQIFGPTAIQITGTENVVRKYGLGGQTEFQHQVANRTKEHWIEFEQALLYGVRVEDAGNKWRAMGGLAYYITTGNGSTVDSSTTTFTESALLALLQACYDLGGAPDRAVMGSKNKRLGSGFTSSGTIQIMRPDNERGTVVDYFDSDFGRIALILDRWCRTQDIFVFEREQAQIATLRPLVFEMLAKTGDSMKGQIVCEKSLKFRRFPHAGRFSALT
jgi:hypothetical protein